MDANELRIGNWIDYLGEPKQVLGVDEETVFLKNTVSINYIDIDEIEPIPLTEEWLLKLGFRKNGIYYELNGIIFNIRNEALFRCFISNTGVVVRNVHELQNLHFALTKQELKYV